MNNNEKTVALLQDMQGLLTEIQPLLTDGKVADLRVAAAVRLIRKETGDLLNDLTNAQRIVDGYREDAIDAIDGVGFLVVGGAADDWTDPGLEQAMFAMSMAAGRIDDYFNCKKRASQEAPECEAG